MKALVGISFELSPLCFFPNSVNALVHVFLCGCLSPGQPGKRHEFCLCATLPPHFPALAYFCLLQVHF